MRRSSMLLAGFLLVALAGCSDGGGGDAEDADSLDADGADGALPVADGGGGAVDAANGTLGGPVFETVPVELEGNMGTWFFLCEAENTGVCQGQTAVAEDNDVDHERPGANLTAAELKLEWTHDTPATETLGISLTHRGGQADYTHNVEGTSPLVLSLSDLDVPLEDGSTLRIAVYNPQGIVHEPPFYGYASVDQSFTLSGSLTLRTA